MDLGETVNGGSQDREVGMRKKWQSSLAFDLVTRHDLAVILNDSMSIQKPDSLISISAVTVVTSRIYLRMVHCVTET